MPRLSRRQMLGSIGIMVGPAVRDSSLAGQGQAPWAVGYGEVDITPRRGYVHMHGFGRERYAKGALAPLIAQVVALRDEHGSLALLIAVDNAGFDRVNTRALCWSIQRKHGVPPEAIIQTASHTHWGPCVKFRTAFAAGAPNVWYMAWMEEQILAAVDRAIESLSPATVEYGSFDYRGIGCNRRLLVNGEFLMRPNPNGFFDGHTPILRIRREGSPRQIIVVGHACHPTSSGAIEKWSPDYPGAMRGCIASRLADTKAVFVQGCGGDAKVAYKDPKTGKLVFAASPERSKEAGEKLAGAALGFLAKNNLSELAGTFAAAHATGQLSYGQRWSRDEIERVALTGVRRDPYTWLARQQVALPDTRGSFRYDVQIWRLGDRLTVFALEGEPCSPWGPKLRAMAHTTEAMVIGYVNDVSAYIGDARIVREGGYEGSRAQKHLPGPFSENIEKEVKSIVAHALEKLPRIRSA